MNRIQNTMAWLVLGVTLIFTNCKNEPAQSTVDFKRTGNEVVIAPLGEAENLNPLLYSSGYAQQAFVHIFQYLEGVHPETMELMPQLVKTRPEVEEIMEGEEVAGLKYTFEILDEAVWPNGNPVTGNDFVFTLKAVYNPKMPTQRFQPYLSSISEVQIDAQNPKRFTIITDEQYILSEEAITTAVPVMPEYVYDPEGLLSDIPLTDFLDSEKISQIAESNPDLQTFADEFVKQKYGREPEGVVGSGAYRLAEWETGQYILLEKKDDWWGDQLEDPNILQEAKVESIEFRPMPDQTVASTAIKDEQMDVRTQIDAANFNELQESELANERYNFYVEPQFAYFFLYLNNKDPRLSDKRVRRALAHLTDVDEIIDIVYEGSAQRIAGPIHPAKSYYNEELTPVPFDVDKAKSLLAEAGWEDTDGNGIVDKEIDGEQVELSLELSHWAGRETVQNMVLIIQEDARQAGVDIQPVPKEATVIAEDRARRDYEMATGGYRISHTLDDLKQIWHSESDTPGGSNQVGFNNEEADQIMDAIQTEFDPQRRRELYMRLQEIIYEEQPVIFLFVNNENIAIHKRFDVETSPLFPGYFPNSFTLREL